MVDRDYDDDVFSLEEDLVREKRKQTVQYVLVALLAAAVIAFALYGSIRLTLMRVEQQKAQKAQEVVVVVPPTDGGENPGVAVVAAVDTNFWPDKAFPEVPAFEAPGYDTKQQDGRAEVGVPSASASDFDAYIDSLSEQGAILRVRTPRLSVAQLGDTEIHFINTNQKTCITLCGEKAYSWSDSLYSAFPLPETGRLVAVKNGVANGRVLTYRGAGTLDALGYVNTLVADGWTVKGSVEPTDNIFLAELTKNNLKISVDYFQSGSDYQLRLDYTE